MEVVLTERDDGGGRRGQDTADRHDGPWRTVSGRAREGKGARMADRSRTQGRWAALSGVEDARRAANWAARSVVDSADLLAQGVTAIAVSAVRARQHHPRRARLHSV